MEKMILAFLAMKERPSKRTVEGIKVPHINFNFSFDSGLGMRTIKSLKGLTKEMKGILLGPYLYPFGHQRVAE